MANIVSNGFFVTGVNNVRVRLYPQILGIYKIHEHNLSNALRDFGMLLKSECSRELIKYKNDYLKFIHMMRSSEICMIAHGYSLINHDDRVWWDSFCSTASKALFDDDGKEISGLLYSLSRVYSTRNEFIDRLIEESRMWLHMASPYSLSLLCKVITHFKLGKEFLKQMNQRVIEVIDEFQILDIIPIFVCNSESRNYDVKLMTKLCTRSIQLIDNAELHQVRAIASSLSKMSLKSQTMFNVLTIRLSQIVKTKLSEGDLMAFILSFTSQKFLTRSDLCIDSTVYKKFISKHSTKSLNIFKFPLPELGTVLTEALNNNKELINPKGIPYIMRAISVLEIPVDECLFNELMDMTVMSLDNDSYDWPKITSLIMTFLKIEGELSRFWKAVYGSMTRMEHQIETDLLSKIVNSIFSSGFDNINYSEDLKNILKLLLKKCPEYSSSMSSRSLSALVRNLTYNREFEVLGSEQFIQSIADKIKEFSFPDVCRISKSYEISLKQIYPSEKLLNLANALDDMVLFYSKHVESQALEMFQIDEIKRSSEKIRSYVSR